MEEPEVVPAEAVKVLPILAVPETEALAIVGAAKATATVALEVAFAVPPAFVTVITTFINLVSSLVVKTYVEEVAPEIFE